MTQDSDVDRSTSTAQEAAEPDPAASSSAGLRARLPTLVAEALGVVFAVLVALAVDEAWEEREDAQLGEQATEMIAREIRENRSELVEKASAERLQEMVASLDSAVAKLRRGVEPEDLDVNYDLALLSTAAWQTAQVSQATQHMPLDRVARLARLYEFQRLYRTRQDRLFDRIVSLGHRMEREEERVAALAETRADLAAAAGLRAPLATLYACTLVELEGSDAPEADACPRPAGGGGSDTEEE